jgi:hypothetical protein
LFATADGSASGSAFGEWGLTAPESQRWPPLDLRRWMVFGGRRWTLRRRMLWGSGAWTRASGRSLQRGCVRACGARSAVAAGSIGRTSWFWRRGPAKKPCSALLVESLGSTPGSFFSWTTCRWCCASVAAGPETSRSSWSCVASIAIVLHGVSVSLSVGSPVNSTAAMSLAGPVAPSRASWLPES